MLLHDLIIDSAVTHSDRRAVARGDESLTYAELAEQVRKAAAGFATLGIQPGDRIGIYLNKRIESAIAYFAAGLAGAVFVPINPVLKAAQVGHILRDCSVTALLTSSAQAKGLTEELAGCSSIKVLILADDGGSSDTSGSPTTLGWNELVDSDTTSPPTRHRIDNDVAAILYTSGSTGKPKGVVLSHRNMVSGAVSVAGYIENTADDVILAALPFSFDAGFSQMTTAFAVGASVVLFDYLLPQDVPRAAKRYGVTGLTGVPPLWNQLTKLEWPAEAADSMRYFANTGGAMPTATLARLRAKFPKAKPFLMYGLTESFRSTYLPPEEVDKRPTSIGKAIPNAEILVVGEDGTICDAGEPGELVHRGALVSLGYWNDPERTAQRFKPLPNQQAELPFAEMTVWSGDTVVKDGDGFLYFVGRKDDMIKSSGYRISPTEVEEVIYKTGLVTECAALGVPHPEIGQAVVITASGQQPTEETSTEITKACQRELPNFMVPSQIVWRDRLPKNPNGKIDRKQLSSELSDLYQTEA